MSAPAAPAPSPAVPAPAPPDRLADHVDVMDGLRAIAILWVMALHVWQLSWLKLDVLLLGWRLNFNHVAETGFLGVELFFFVSGFCLFYPYVRSRLEDRAWPSLGHYWYRRAIKILPSYWLAIALILLYAHPAWLSDPKALAWNLGSHLVFAQNLWYQTESAINGVFWSLGVEVQFYLLFPALAWAFVRRPAITYGAMCLAAILWRAEMQLDYHGDFRLLMDQLPGYLDLFANGMLAAMVIVWLRARQLGAKAWEIPATLASFGLLYGVSLMAKDLWDSRIGNADWPWAWQVEHRYHLALAFCLLAIVSSRAMPDWKRMLAGPVMAFFSTISYNLYIYHQFIARELMNTWKVPAPLTADPHADPTWQLWFTLNAVAVAVAFATAVTYLFERPLLRDGPRALLAPFQRLLGRPSAPVAPALAAAAPPASETVAEPGQA